MFKNYFKTAWRNITRTIGYSILNIVGLAIGMAVALLIGLWIYDQYSFDKFLPEYQSVYRAQRNFDSNGDTLTFQTTSLKLADALRTQIPEIEYDKFPGNKSCNSKSGKKFKNGMINVNGDTLILNKKS